MSNVQGGQQPELNEIQERVIAKTVKLVSGASEKLQDAGIDRELVAIGLLFGAATELSKALGPLGAAGALAALSDQIVRETPGASGEA